VRQALRDGGRLPEAAQDAHELGGGDEAIAVGAEDHERAAQVLLYSMGGGRPHQRDELIRQADVAIRGGGLHERGETRVG